jgi:hypothetical protein
VCCWWYKHLRFFKLYNIDFGFLLEDKARYLFNTCVFSKTLQDVRVVLVSYCKVNTYFDRVQSTCPFDSWQSEHSVHIFIALTDCRTCSLLNCLLCLVNTLYKCYQIRKLTFELNFDIERNRISGKDNLRHSCFICDSPVCNTLKQFTPTASSHISIARTCLLFYKRRWSHHLFW